MSASVNRNTNTRKK